MPDMGTNVDANKVVFDNANNVFQQQYYMSKMANDNDAMALAKAAQAWKQTVDTAAMTGEFNGNPTQAAMQFYSNTFGSWAKPEMGAETLAANQQKFGQTVTAANLTGMYNGQLTQQAQKQQSDLAAQQAGLLGYYNAPGTTPGGPGQGQQTLAAQQQYWAQQQAEQVQADKNRQDYLQMIGQLRGPADYGQYLKVLGSTPQGLQGLVGAAAGQYQMGTGSSGQAPVPVSLGSFMNSGATGQSQQYAAGAGPYAQPYQYQGGAPQLTPQPGQMQAQPPQQTGYQQAQGAQQTAMGQQPQSTSYASYMAAAQGLPPPNQIAPQNYNQMTTTQKQLLGGMYEQQGYALPDVADMYKQSLPKYGSQTAQTGGLKLR